MSTSTYDRILHLLYDKLASCGRTPDRLGCEKTYFSDHPANIVEGDIPAAVWAAIEKELQDGSGNELKPRKHKASGKVSPPKFDAIHSSSALVVNTFGRWKPDPKDLVICGRTGFTEIAFERKLKTGFRGVPNLDLYLGNSGTVITASDRDAHVKLRRVLHALELLLVLLAELPHTLPVTDNATDRQMPQHHVNHVIHLLLIGHEEHQVVLESPEPIGSPGMVEDLGHKVRRR